MGNLLTCEDCTREVPNRALFLSNRGANCIDNIFSSNTWIKLGDSKFLCPNCLDRRNENRRRREPRERGAAEEARQREEQRRREEEQRRREEEQRRREEEQRRREEEQRRREEEQRRREEEQRRREEEQRGREINDILDEVFKQIVSRSAELNPEVLRKTFTKDYSNDQLSNCIAQICYAVESTKKYWPRKTQLVSLCLLIKSLQKGRLLEIKTGEGKSCIVAMFAVFLALSGRSIDIVTSSPILAVRDADEWRGFYKEFEIGVDCNLKPKENEDRLKCYKKPVVYGTVGSFASDILRQEFLMKDVRGDRTFDAVIVDEVDSMLIDQGVNFTYLSSPAPGMHHIQPILLMIWNEVIRHPVVRSDLGQDFFVGKQEPLDALLCRLEENGVLRKGFEKSLFSKEMNKEKMIECLLWVESDCNISIEMFEMHDESIIHKVNQDHDGTQAHLQLLIVGEGLVCVLYQDMETLCELIKTKTESFLTTRCQNEEDCRYEFPSYLSEFVSNRLPRWIDNAFLAISMKEGREYLIKDQEIVPVDFESTGAVELNTKWGDGLHQFLELNHQKKLSQMRLVTNFMSNQAFFKRYPGKLFGLSGTLGSESELAFLQTYYGLSYSRIPTFLQKRFSEQQGILCSNKNEWLKYIEKEVQENTSSVRHGGKRAVLIICEDINTAKEVKESLRCSSVTLFTENEQKENIDGKKLTGGDVIIATNIAGRGTDIEIDKSVVKAGGLFVLVTFLPWNLRVENQVFGRCARKGQPGSARLVINKESLPQNEPFIDILELKKIREENAERQQDCNEKYLFSSTIPRENLFSFYCQFTREAAKEMKDGSKFERNILLSSMHEFWGLWLEMYCENLDGDTFEELKLRLNEALHKAKSHVMNKTSPCANLYHIIKVANERRKNKDFAEAEKLYTKAIETDNTWAAIAYYNRAYCRLLQRKDGYMEEAIRDLNKARRGFRKYNDEIMHSITLLSILPKGTESEDESTPTTKSQFDTRIQILNFYKENIDKALKKLDELKKEKKDAKAVGHCALTIVEDRLQKKLDSELLVFWDLGLTEIFSVERRSGFNWKAGLVVLFGMVQITVGAFVVACSGGLLANVGWGLVTEGISDIWTGARAFWKGDQNFVKSWAFGKAASIAISIATCGFGQIKSAVKGTKGFKSALAAVKEKVTTAGKEMSVAMKEIPKQVSSKSFPAVMEKACKEVAVQNGKKLGTRVTKHVFESVDKKLKTNFETETREQLKKELDKAMKSKGEFKDSLEKFIIIHSKNGRKKEEIADEFSKIHQRLLESTNTIGQLKGILHGCVKSLLKVVKGKMETSSPGVFKGVISPILDIVDTCQKQSSVDVKHLVSVYCQEAGKALKDIYKDKECLQNQETDNSISEVKLFLASKIEDLLFQLIQDSFKSTVDSAFIGKLQGVVGGIVSNFSYENGFGENILKNISNISKNEIKNELSKFTGLIKDGEAIHNAFNLAKNTLLAALPDEEKKKVGDLFDAFQGGVKALQSKDGLSMDKIRDLAKKGLEMLPDEERKKLRALGDTCQGVAQLSKYGITGLNKNSIMDLARKGAEMLPGEEKKKLRDLGDTCQGVAQLSKDGITGLNTDSIMDLARKGAEMLPDEQKNKVGASLNAFQGGIKALQSKDGSAIIKYGLDMLPDDEKQKAGAFLDSFQNLSQNFTNYITTG